MKSLRKAKTRRKSKVRRKSKARKHKTRRKSKARKHKTRRKSKGLSSKGLYVEFGSVPIYSDSGVIFTKGIIDCLVVTLQKVNSFQSLTGIIAGHFVTGIEHKTSGAMWSETNQNFTKDGVKFISKMIELAKKEKFKNDKDTDLVVYYRPMSTGTKHKQTDNVFQKIKESLKGYYGNVYLRKTLRSTWTSDRISI